MNKGLDKNETLCVTSESERARIFEKESIQVKTDIGRRIVEALDYKTDSEIACILKTRCSTIKSLTDGMEFPKTEILLEIYKVTGISIHWLLTGKEAKSTKYAGAYAPISEEIAARLA